MSSLLFVHSECIRGYVRINSINCQWLEKKQKNGYVSWIFSYLPGAPTSFEKNRQSLLTKIVVRHCRYPFNLTIFWATSNFRFPRKLVGTPCSSIEKESFGFWLIPLLKVWKWQITWDVIKYTVVLCYNRETDKEEKGPPWTFVSHIHLTWEPFKDEREGE